MLPQTEDFMYIRTSSILQNYYLDEKTGRYHHRLQSYFLMTLSYEKITAVL